MRDLSLFERDSITLTHSLTVAMGAYRIAERTTTVDPVMAYHCGFFHDVGKLYLEPFEFYKHPFIGFSLMKEHREMAAVCLTHPFPQGLSSPEAFLSFCHNDAAEAQRIQDAFASLSLNEELQDFVEIVQLCDKMAGLTSFISLDQRKQWYQKSSNVAFPSPKILEQNFSALDRLKKKWDDRVRGDVAEILQGFHGMPDIPRH